MILVGEQLLAVSTLDGYPFGKMDVEWSEELGPLAICAQVS